MLGVFFMDLDGRQKLTFSDRLAGNVNRSDALKTVLDNMLNLTFHPDVSQEIKPSYDWYQIHADNLYVVAIMHNSKNPVG